ncbi:MAG: hypothetical protein IPN23_07595 [Elusimicrobia bacterium]|nr:hypothetical protein [Elusimicrobiota bacterium]
MRPLGLVKQSPRLPAFQTRLILTVFYYIVFLPVAIVAGRPWRRPRPTDEGNVLDAPTTRGPIHRRFETAALVNILGELFLSRRRGGPFWSTGA